MKTFFQKHMVALGGLLAFAATFLPFIKADYIVRVERYSVIDIIRVLSGFYTITLFVVPIVLIVLDFVLSGKNKKIACVTLSAVNLVGAIAVYALLYRFLSGRYVLCSPAVGFIIVCLVDAALVVLAVLFSGKNFEENSNAKAKKVIKEVSKKVASTATSVGSEAVSASKEQSELLGLKSEINVIDKEIDASYLMTGKKYVEYVLETGEMPAADISDMLKLINPKLKRKEELEGKIITLEKRIRDEKIIREKQNALKEFEEEKEKLEKALKMDIIEQDEYDSKVKVLQKRFDNFENIRKLEQQVDIGIITKEEKEKKINELLK